MNDTSSVAQTEVWFPFINAFQQPVVIAWFAFGILALTLVSIWVYVAKRRALKSSVRKSISRAIRVETVPANSPVAKSA